jgi:pimeloyl-ACP methyl ester carboxylesterase
MTTRKLIKNENNTVEVIVDGNSGRSIVLIPSWGRDSEDFAPIAEALARAGYRVLRPVPRGAGATDGAVDNVSMFDLASDIVAVIEQERTGPAIVAGHALGAYVARAVATLRPDLVSGVALLAVGQREPVAKDIAESVIKSGDMSLSEAERLIHIRHIFIAPGNDPRCWLTGWHAAAGRASASAFKTPPHSEYWQAGGRPVLDLIAESDPLRPPATYNNIKDDLGKDRVSVVVVPNASHALPVEQPARVVDALLGFARQLKI